MSTAISPDQRATIHRQNIEHYRSLLESGKLDTTRRGAVETLLSEEEAKLKAIASPEETEKSDTAQRKS